MAEPMDRTLEYHFQIGFFRCVAKYRPNWQDIKVEIEVGDWSSRLLCGSNLTLLQVQEYAAQKLLGELKYELEIVQDYADQRRGKK
jgi:hypothetical protein